MPYKDLDKRREYKRNYNRTHQTKLSLRQSNRRYGIKVEVLTHYGHGKLGCVKCGFSDIRALSVDHVNGNGANQRRNDKATYHNLYRWLRQHNYPDGYQTLCMNCNWIKRVENREFASTPPKPSKPMSNLFDMEVKNANLETGCLPKKR